jgi:hypothetical protein
VSVVRNLFIGVLALCLAAVLTGCGSDDDPSSKESTMSKTSALSMEKALARYDEMRRKMIAALDREIGHQSWGNAPNEDGIIRAGCKEDESDSENVNMRTLVVNGTYPESDWKKSASVVEKIGQDYGFETVKVIVDRPGDFSMTGLAKDGASYNYGLAKNTILGVHTGCHVWDDKPTPGS